MSKGILEFDLPEEQDEFETATNAYSYRIALDDIYNNIIRQRTKYGYSETTIDELLEKIADEYREIVSDLKL
jgi:cell division septum initiation protein DivIVA